MLFRDLLIAQAQEKREFAVTFDSSGGEAIPVQTITEGELATSVTPKRTGYDFTGWYLNGSVYDFNTPVTSDIVLTAGWNILTFTVTFNTNGGNAIAAQTVAYGNKATSIIPEKDSYTFTGWTCNGAAFDFNSQITSDITLEAGWQYVPQLRTQSGNFTAYMVSAFLGDVVYMRIFRAGSVNFPDAFKEVPKIKATYTDGSNLVDITSICTVTNSGFSWPETQVGRFPGPGSWQFSGIWTATGYY